MKSILSITNSHEKSKKKRRTLIKGGSAKSRNRSFCVLRKSKTGNFSAVTLQAATLKIPDFVFSAIHPIITIGTFVSRVIKDGQDHAFPDRIFRNGDGLTSRGMPPDLTQQSVKSVNVRTPDAVTVTLHRPFGMGSGFPDTLPPMLLKNAVLKPEIQKIDKKNYILIKKNNNCGLLLGKATIYCMEEEMDFWIRMIRNFRRTAFRTKKSF